MPERKTIKRAQKAKREGKAPTTQAGEFVREEIEHIREGKHGAKNTKQAIAIGLSKARRAGVKLGKPPGRKLTKSEREHQGRISGPKSSGKRSVAGERRLKGESTNVVSHRALSHQAKRSASERSAADRHRSALKAARTREENKKAA